MRRTTKAVISGHDSWVKLCVYRQCRGMFLFRHYVQQLKRERPSSFMSDTRNIIVSQVVVGENCFECSSGGVTRARTCLTNVWGWWKTSCCILLALLYRHQHVSSKKKARKKRKVIPVEPWAFSNIFSCHCSCLLQALAHGRIWFRNGCVAEIPKCANGEM